MEGVGMRFRDLHPGLEEEEGNIGGVELFEEEEDGKTMWLEVDQEVLLNDSYTEFPPLPDFQCMLLSPSSLTASADVKAMASTSSASSSSSGFSASSSLSSSSAAPWAVPKSDVDEDGEKRNHLYGLNVQLPAKLSSAASIEITRGSVHGVDFMDEMETFGCMEMLEGREVFGPSCIFQSENELHRNPENPILQIDSIGSNRGTMEGKGEEDKDKEEMGRVFLEWLRTNRETVSAEDLRSVRIKKSTIESAARNLGGGKEGINQLLKLVLQWVQTNHLQKRRSKGPFPSSNPNSDCDSNSDSMARGSSNSSSFAPNPWLIQPPSFVTERTVSSVPTAQPSYPPPMAGYMSHNPYPPQNDQFQMLDSSQTWLPSQFSLASTHFGSYTENNLQLHQQGFSSGNEYLNFHGQGKRLQRLGFSASKEARKKRMARQRRPLSYHRHHSVHQNHNHQNQFLARWSDHQQLGTDENCTTELLAPANSSNWVYWLSPADGVSPQWPKFSSDLPPVPPSDPASTHNQTFAGKTAFDRRQGWKGEKNLKFLLQKVLKQSDVGNLGRIVLPKKEAETHLPELEARDGISIAMEDIATSQVWSMRYRYWPNNKSRMYLLENTGDFVKANGLKEGDFIVIYSDLKCGKYMIRGVKVRQPGLKSESKRQAKPQRNLQQNAP